LRELGIDPTTI